MDRKIIFILIVAVFAAAICLQFCIAAAGGPAMKSPEQFQLKIPDGLYLFHDITDQDEVLACPFMLVKKGRLFDFYGVTEGETDEECYKDLDDLIGKTLKVFIGDEPVGTFKPAYYDRLPDIDGTYEGTPLDYGLQKSLIYSRDNIGDRKISNAMKAVFAPRDYTPQRKVQIFPVAQEDVIRLEDAVRRISGKALEHVKRQGEKATVVDGSIKQKRLESLLALDLDGNGKKDFIGIAIFEMKIKEKKSVENREYEMIFVFSDTGQFDVLEITSEDIPSFSLCGIMDLDRDGIFEIIIQQTISPEKYPPVYPFIRQISIMRRGPSGWERVFRSDEIIIV